MTEPTLNYVSCADASGGHRMAYWQWGDSSAGHVVVCVHGLSRQGRDFDVLARSLVHRAGGRLRVVCPDVVGRGKSDWLKDPMGYELPTYVGDMLAMLGQLHQQAPMTEIDWVGTSMGGLIGIGLAGTPKLPLPARVHRMVFNDVGPAIEYSAIERIKSYLGKTGRFDTVQQAADAMWAISKGFGPHTPEQWMALSKPMVRELPEGGFTLHYDPAIAVPVQKVTPEAAAQGEATLWQLYENIKARVLVTRGAESDLFAKDTALQMTQRGPRASLVEFPGVGHAPMFVQDNQVEAVALFLLDSANEKPESGTG
jgi:pimeloyl-ACP methyl ester carboxylesterase